MTKTRIATANMRMMQMIWKAEAIVTVATLAILLVSTSIVAQFTILRDTPSTLMHSASLLST